MSYKTILVHLSDKRRAEALLEPAVDLATRYNPHLLGLHAYAAALRGSMRSGVAHEHGQGEEIAATFSRMTARGAFVSEWHLLKVPHVDLASVVIQNGYAADLIITGQADPDWDMSALLDFPEQLALESGRPVLVIPYAGHYPRVGRNVVIAWKACREAARAVFDALPLLLGAENVHILEVKGRGDET